MKPRNDKEWLLISDLFIGQGTDNMKQVVEQKNGKNDARFFKHDSPT